MILGNTIVEINPTKIIHNMGKKRHKASKSHEVPKALSEDEVIKTTIARCHKYHLDAIQSQMIEGLGIWGLMCVAIPKGKVEDVIKEICALQECKEVKDMVSIVIEVAGKNCQVKISIESLGVHKDHECFQGLLRALRDNGFEVLDPEAAHHQTWSDWWMELCGAISGFKSYELPLFEDHEA